MATRGRRGRPQLNPGFGKADTKNGSTVHPSILKQARKSGQLNLSGRSFTAVPDAVWNLYTDVPDESKDVCLDNSEDRWWDSAELTKLILASNWLTSLAEDISNFGALTVLDLHDNRLESLPKTLGSLKNLQKLDISRNKLFELPECVTEAVSLRVLHMAHNQITRIDERIGSLNNLEDLDMSNNQLMALPRRIGHLSRLSKFNASNNKIQRLPPEVGSMFGLRYFDLTHNDLGVLPDELGQLLYLEQLYVRHNHLADIPLLSQCNKLKELHLGNNRIQQITMDHLECLKSVTVLDLRDNQLAVLPEAITLLEGLERLDLSNNNLPGLPFTLGLIVSLKSIVLDGNPMKSIRRDIIMRGTMELKKYLQSRIDEPKPPPISSQGLESTEGQSGIIGGSGDGVSAHDMHTSKLLEYSGKQATEVPLDVWAVAEKSGVMTVDISKNKFSELPDNLMLLQDTLKVLNLGFNRFTSLHQDISLFMNLVSLDLRNNSLSELPSDMESLENMRDVFLSYNRFTIIPPVLFELKKLEILFMDNCKVDTVDAAGVCSLPRIGTLDLQNNNISQVPPELGNCSQLKSLQLGGNPFRNPRPAVLAKGTPALLEYLRNKIVS
ncbi:leucine-rich repeat-containing protein 40-like [Ylistrum balloti]|uniref:leucine-rich repeat-containing protein 40-like n=1 Tax=Ylistrum balloti TaxID=509963 RepID=UPI0029059F16|nr:leucine-rich repeat-containing protein 40-like [Ylistrum balloti]